MAYAHIAHDCRIGNHTIFSNNATLAGHVEIGDYVILSGFSGVHQFCRVGAYAFIGMGCLVNGDVPPFLILASDYGRPRGINTEGLKRRGFSPQRITAIRRAYKTLYMSGLQLNEAREQLAQLGAESEDIAAMLAFLDQSQRPLMRDDLSGLGIRDSGLGRHPVSIFFSRVPLQPAPAVGIPTLAGMTKLHAHSRVPNPQSPVPAVRPRRRRKFR